MRLTLYLALALVVATILWLLTARSISEWVDRWHTVRTRETPVQRVRFDNGVIEVAGIRLDTFTPETVPSGLIFIPSSGGRVLLRYQGREFPCGPGGAAVEPAGLPDVSVSPDAGDTVTFSAEQSYLSWFTPWEMNFMTGSAPSRRRHLYCRLIWTKRSGARLEILWRFRQGYFGAEGWRPQTIEHGSAGMLHVAITDAPELRSAAAEYLLRTRSWKGSEYRLEDRGPASDGSGEVVAAIHTADERGAEPGSGQSITLVMDYASRRVAREIGFQ